jgi:hypothetical protein
MVASEIENGLEAERNNQSKGESDYDSSSSEGKAVDLYHQVKLNWST